MSKSKILLIYTGGTIGMIREAGQPYLSPFNFENILDRVKEIKLLNCQLETISINKPIDSSNIQIENWIELVEIIKTNYNFPLTFIMILSFVDPPPPFNYAPLPFIMFLSLLL